MSQGFPDWRLSLAFNVLKAQQSFSKWGLGKLKLVSNMGLAKLLEPGPSNSSPGSYELYAHLVPRALEAGIFSVPIIPDWKYWVSFDFIKSRMNFWKEADYPDSS